MSRSSQRRKRRGLSYATTLAPVILVAVLIALLPPLRYTLLFERRMRVQSMPRNHTSSSPPRPALITMADPSFQYCAMQLLTSARNLKWKHPIFLLAIDFHHFHPDIVQMFQMLGVFIVETNPIYDKWLTMPVDRNFLYRQLDFRKFRKMELFLNPIFRAFERLIFIDADGILYSRMDPLITLRFPSNVTVLMRQNDKSFKKKTLWGNEVAGEALTDKQLSSIFKKYPDRSKAGGSSWFIVDVKKLPPPDVIFSESLSVICNYRAAFKLNDQTLLNLLFYDSLSLFPWCVWDIVPIIDEPDELKRFCDRHMHLQRRINGGLTFMYRHMSVKEKRACVTASKLLGSASGNRIPIQKQSIRNVEQEESSFALLNNNKSCTESWREWTQKLRPKGSRILPFR